MTKLWNCYIKSQSISNIGFCVVSVVLIISGQRHDRIARPEPIKILERKFNAKLFLKHFDCLLKLFHPIRIKAVKSLKDQLQTCQRLLRFLVLVDAPDLDGEVDRAGAKNRIPERIFNNCKKVSRAGIKGLEIVGISDQSPESAEVYGSKTSL